VKPAYNKTRRGRILFFIAGRFHLIWVLEVSIPRIPDLWGCIKVFHARQISVMPDFI